MAFQKRILPLHPHDTIFFINKLLSLESLKTYRQVVNIVQRISTYPRLSPPYCKRPTLIWYIWHNFHEPILLCHH